MEQITGRVESDGQTFYADSDGSEKRVNLYSTRMQEAQEPRLVDLQPYAGQRIEADCQTWGGGEDAWGVENVRAAG